LLSLLKQQNIYWKQRASIKWTTLGDGSTKFFHANATIRYRRNLISALEDSEGFTVKDHSAKAQLIWEAFKERLGASSFQGISFNLSSLVHPAQDLFSLVEHFLHEEINLVVKSLPTDKAPGPNDFNTDFIKKCWSIICHNFYALCNAFYNCNVWLQSLMILT